MTEKEQKDGLKEEPTTENPDATIPEAPAELPDTGDDGVDKLGADNSEKNNSNVNASANPAAATGQGAVPTFAKFATGKTRTLAMGQDEALSTGYDPEITPKTVSDFDSRDVTDTAAMAAYNAIESTFIDEGTLASNVAPSKDDEEKPHDAIYALDTLVNTETRVGLHTKAAINDPRRRENGKLYLTEPGKVFMAANHYQISGKDAEGEYIEGVDSKLGWDSKSFVLLNELDPTGSRITSAFRMVRKGTFVLKGINPLPEPGADIIIGYVNRANISGDIVERIPVKISATKLFNVLEITPSQADVTSVVDKMQEYMVNNVNKLRLNGYETLAGKLENLWKTAIDRKAEIKEYPDFARDAKRSTLFKTDTDDMSIRVGGVDVDASCYNDDAKLLEMFDEIQASNVMLVAMRDNMEKFKQNMIYHKTLKGKGNFSPYYYEQGLNLEYDGVPNLKHFFPQFGTSPVFDTEAKIIRKFGLFWKHIKEVLKDIDDSPLYTQMMSEWYVVDTSVEDAVHAFEYGRLTSDNNTSHDVFKDTEELSIAMGFNPNDLIGVTSLDHSQAITVYNPSGYKINGIGNKDAIKRPYIYPCCGYAVVAVDKNKRPNAAIYNVIPRWMLIITSALNSVDFLKQNIFTQKDGKQANYCCMKYFFTIKEVEVSKKTYYTLERNGHEYLPYTWHHTGITWLDWILAAAIDRNEDYRNKNELTNDGLCRYQKFINEIDSEGILKVGKISLRDLLGKIMSNDRLYHDPARTDTSILEVLHNPTLSEDPYKAPIASLAKVKLSGSDDKETCTIAIFEALRFDRRLADLSGFRAFDFIGGRASDAVFAFQSTELAAAEGVQLHDILYDIVPDGVSDSKKKFSVKAINNYGSSVLCDKDGKVILFKRQLLNKSKIRADILVDGADPSLLGYTDPTTELFARDNHEWVAPYDAFVCVITEGKDVSDPEEIGSGNAYFKGFNYQFKMCGAMVFTETWDMDGGKSFKDEAIANKGRLSYATKAPCFKLGFRSGPESANVASNVLFSSADATVSDKVEYIQRNIANMDSAGYTGTTDKYVYGNKAYATKDAALKAAIKELQKSDPQLTDAEAEAKAIQAIYERTIVTPGEVWESKLVGKLAIPSLWTGKPLRMGRLLATYVKSTDNGDEFASGYGFGTVSYASDYNLDHALDVFESDGGRIAVGKATAANILKIGNGERVMGNWVLEAYLQPTVYFDKRYKELFTHNYAVADRKNFAEAYAMAKVRYADKPFFAISQYFSSNMKAIKTVYKMAYVSSDDIFRMAGMLASEEIFSLHETYVPSKATGKQDTLEPVFNDLIIAEVVEEFALKHGINKRLNFVPGRLILIGTGDKLGLGTTETAISVNPLATREPRVIRSHMYVNDYRDYVYGDAIITTNLDWERGLIGKTTFAEKFCK